MNNYNPSLFFLQPTFAHPPLQSAGANVQVAVTHECVALDATKQLTVAVTIQRNKYICNFFLIIKRHLVQNVCVRLHFRVSSCLQRCFSFHFFFSNRIEPTYTQRSGFTSCVSGCFLYNKQLKKEENCCFYVWDFFSGVHWISKSTTNLLTISLSDISP